MTAAAIEVETKVFALCKCKVTDAVCDYLQDEYCDTRNKAFMVNRFDNPQELCNVAYGGAGNGYRTVCLLDRNSIGNIRKMDIKKALSFIMLCDAPDTSVLRYLMAEGIPVWIPSNVNELYETVRDCALISELLSQPSLILLQKNLIEAGEFVELKGSIEMENVRKKNKKERQEIFDSINIKVNRILDKGKTGIIGYGENYERACEIVGEGNGYKKMRINFVYSNTMNAIRNFTEKCDTVISFTGLTEKYKAFEIKQLSCRDEEIRKYIDSVINEKQKRKLRYVGPPINRSERPKPYVPKESNAMCAGCVYRTRLCHALTDNETEYVYEKVYCCHRDEYVSAGVDSRVLHYEDEGIMKIRENFGYKEIKTIKSDSTAFPDCIIRSADKVYVTYKCDSCLECINKTGCPAIWNKGFVTRIDSSRCTGCGLCLEYCFKGGLEWSGISLYADTT